MGKASDLEQIRLILRGRALLESDRLIKLAPELDEADAEGIDAEEKIAAGRALWEDDRQQAERESAVELSSEALAKELEARGYVVGLAREAPSATTG